MVVTIDQPRQDDQTGCVKDLVHLCCRLFARFYQRKDPVILNYNTVPRVRTVSGPYRGRIFYPGFQNSVPANYLPEVYQLRLFAVPAMPVC